MEMNYLPIIVAGLVPMIVGAIYYGPLLGKQWQSAAGLSDEDIASGNMPLIYSLALLMSMFISFGINLLTELTHGSFGSDDSFIPGSDYNFGHGAFHGVTFACLTIIPALVIVSLFHRMTAKNILINVGYWIITCALIGGITDAWN